MRFQTNGAKGQFLDVLVKSDESSVTIKAGAPVFYKPDSSNVKGLAVVSSEGLTAVLQPFFAGIATQEIAPGKFGNARCYGLMLEARVAKMTRAASTDSWASYPAGAIGDILTPQTLAGVQALLAAAAAGSATNNMWNFILAEAFVSTTTLGSSYSSGNLAIVDTLRVFVRTM